jgi:hypothetical protein
MIRQDRPLSVDGDRFIIVLDYRSMPVCVQFLSSSYILVGLY